jgi:hypothetical protein
MKRRRREKRDRRRDTERTFEILPVFSPPTPTQHCHLTFEFLFSHVFHVRNVFGASGSKKVLSSQKSVFPWETKGQIERENLQLTAVSSLPSHSQVVREILVRKSLTQELSG